MINWIKQLFQNRTFGARRSSQWRSVRAEHLKRHPKCEVTGSIRDLEVHHRYPLHLFPDEELNPDNLVTLRDDVHFLLGHLSSWRSYNPNLKADIERLKESIINRP